MDEDERQDLWILYLTIQDTFKKLGFLGEQDDKALNYAWQLSVDEKDW